MKPGKIIVFTLTALFVLGVLFLAVHFLIFGLAAMLVGSLGLEEDSHGDAWITALTFFAVVWLFPKRFLVWNRPYACHAKLIIEAPTDQVWDAIELRARNTYYPSTVNRITAVPETGDEFHLHFDEKFKDPTSAPEPLSGPDFLHLKVTAREPGAYLAYDTLNADALPLFGKDIDRTEIFMEPTENGTEVTFVETLRRLTLMTFLAFLFLNPARDGLRSLKAQIERTENPSLLARWADETPEDGGAPESVKSAFRLAGLVAMVTVIAVSALLIWGVLALATQ